jgi:hypothetical protein
MLGINFTLFNSERASIYEGSNFLHYRALHYQYPLLRATILYAMQCISRRTEMVNILYLINLNVFVHCITRIFKYDLFIICCRY